MHRRVSKILRLIPPALILSLAPALVVASALDLPAIVRHAPPDPDGDPPQWLNRAVGLFDQGALANEMKGRETGDEVVGRHRYRGARRRRNRWLARVQQIADDLAAPDRPADHRR